MPEGDTIFRAARTLNQALAGRTVTRFDSVFSHLTRVDDTAPLRGRTIERVDARGKHLLIWFSGDLVLRTHMRMHGSWHIYRPGERWQRPHADMRIVIATPEYEAVAFSVPVAELTTARDLERTAAMRDLGPDILVDEFDMAEVVRRIEATPDDRRSAARSDRGRRHRKHLQIGIAVCGAREPIRARRRAVTRRHRARRRRRTAADAGERDRAHGAVFGVRTRGSSVPSMRDADLAAETGRAGACHLLVRAVPVPPKPRRGEGGPKARTC